MVGAPMTRSPLLFASLWGALALAAACGSGSPREAASQDAGGTAPVAIHDAGKMEAGTHDGGARDSGTIDAAHPPEGGTGDGGTTYDEIVLAHRPVAFWDVRQTTGNEPDLTGNGHDGTYMSTPTALGTMPNGDAVAVFDGSSQYLSIPSSPVFSIPTTGDLTWEGWIRPDVLEFPNASAEKYVNWMGKCEGYSPSCEWEARMYSTTNPAMRCNRMSAYVFNPTASLGSAADWQPTCGLIQAGHWYHVVGEYTVKSQPATCTNTATYPGSINVWVDGVPWSQPDHDPTGCMSQYSVIPKANGSPLDIGTMAMDNWFTGGIGKVALYDRLLSQAEITSHYRAMTGLSPSGSCGTTCTLQ